MSGASTQTRAATVTAQAGTAGPRLFKATLYPRLCSAGEATKELPRGSVWLVRIIEAGQSLNGETYTEEAVKGGASVFEGVPCCLYGLNGDPTADSAGHLSEEVSGQFPSGLFGSMVGTLQDVHWNETAKALDAYLVVYDQAVREKLLAAWDLGDIGEGGKRDAFGLSIDAMGDMDEAKNVLRFTSANAVDLVNVPAAGGRIRRLVAALGGKVETKAKKKAKTPLLAAVERKLLREAMSKLESDARIRLILGEASRALSGLEFHSEDEDMATRAARAKAVAEELVAALNSLGGEQPAAEPEATDEEGMAMAASYRRLVANAATIAQKLKLMADALSTAPDEEALDVLAAIKAAVDQALADMQGEDEGPDENQEGHMADKDKQQQTKGPAATPPAPQVEAQAAATQATVKTVDTKASVLDLIKRRGTELSAEVKAELVASVGAELPEEDERDRTIKLLQQQLRDQAISHEFARLEVELQASGQKLVDGPLILTLIDHGKLKVKGTTVEGLKEAVADVLASKPYLVSKLEAAQPAEGDAAKAEGKAEPAAQKPAETAAPAGAGTQAKVKSGVKLQEQFREADAKTVDPAELKRTKERLRARVAMGDREAYTELRHLNGHRW